MGRVLKIVIPFRGHAMPTCTDNTVDSSRVYLGEKVWEGLKYIYILPDLPSANSVIFGVPAWARSASSSKSSSHEQSPEPKNIAVSRLVTG